MVIFADSWNPDRGGRERYAADLVAYLRSIDVPVTTIDRAHASRRGLSTRAGSDTTLLALSPFRAATHYQLHGGLLATAFAAERESMASAVRRAFFAPALTLNRRRQRLLDEEARMLGNAPALMAFSCTVARELVERYGIPASRVTVARPGIDLTRFCPAGPETATPAGNVRRLDDRNTHDHDDRIRLIFVGHNFALKGLRTAIRSLVRLQHLGVNAALGVVGRGRTAPYRRLAERLGLSGRIRFLGALSQDTLAGLYRASDVLVHPTFFDPFPRVVIEALACGCPVVTTRQCGAAEILTSREAVLIDDPRDEAALANATAVFADRREVASMREAAAALGATFDARSHFSTTAHWLGIQRVEP